MSSTSLAKGYSDNFVKFENDLDFNFTTDTTNNFKITTEVKNININVAENANVKLFIAFDLNTSAIDFNVHLNDYANLELVLLNKFEEIESNYNVNVKKGATFNQYIVDLSTKSKSMINVLLEDEHASSNINTSSVVTTNSVIDSYMNVVHGAPTTSSFCLNRSVVATKGKYYNKTIGSIANGNNGSKCSQDTKSLILDQSALAQCDPILLIDEYDVEASHAAAVGQVNTEDLYYLQSRGLDYDSCVKLLVHGFLVGVLANISSEELKEQLIEEIGSSLTI